jgi:hypothetical protein
MVSTRRLKLTAKKRVGGQTSLSSLIRNARTPDLDINGLLCTFAAATPGAGRVYDLTSKVPREISSTDFARILVTSFDLLTVRGLDDRSTLAQHP